MKILVVGGFGYVGSRIFDKFLSLHFDVFRSTSRLNVPSLLDCPRTLYIDLSDIPSIIEILSSFDVVINAYGLDSASCSKNPSLALTVNGVYTTNLISAASQSCVDLFVYFSTAHVYSSPLAGLVDENSYLSNLHPYATSHAAGELSAMYFSRNSLLKTLIIRLANAFGPPIHYDSNCWSLFANDISKQAINSHSITINNNPYASLDFVPLTCLTTFLVDYVGSRPNQPIVDVLNFGSFSSITLLDFAQLVQQRCQSLFGFSPALFYSDKLSTTFQSTEFQFRSKYASILPKITRHHLLQEIDSLLIYCQENSLNSHDS